MLAATLNRSTSWEYGEPKTEAGTTTSPVPSTLGGGILEQFPPALYPDVREMVSTPLPDSKGVQEPLSLNLWFPKHVDHDGATVSAASVRVQALGGTLSEAEMRAVLAVAGWPSSEVPNALRVSWCESRWSAYATNGVDNGLFGMSSAPNATLRGGWLTYWGFSEEQTFDPVVNATAALWTWQRSGWGPWSCRP